MILEEFALLASDTARTKAYIQAMIAEEKLPSICIVYSDHIDKMQEEAERYTESRSDGKYFDVEIPILYSLNKNSIPYILVYNKDINSEQIEAVLQKIPQKYLIYSGYGGYILQPHLFRLGEGRKIIHVHAGLLPQYRGSTTVYYSILQENKIGATAIFLNEGIDEGEIITQKSFKIPPEPVNIDYIYEPYIRSKVLIEAINLYLEKGHSFVGIEQLKEDAQTYFIIHPVLKHIAMLKMERQQKE